MIEGEANTTIIIYPKDIACQTGVRIINEARHSIIGFRSPNERSYTLVHICFGEAYTILYG